MPASHRLKQLTIALIIILLLVSAGYVALIKAINPETYRKQIIAELQKNLNRPVSYKSVNLSFSFGPAASFHGITIKETDGSGDFITIETLTVRFDIMPLLRKQLVFHGLTADKAAIRIERRSDGSFNISDLLESSGAQGTSVTVKQLKMTGAEITFIDSFVRPKPLLARFADTDMYLEHLARGSKGSFKLSTHLGGELSGYLAVNGKVKLAPSGSPLANSVLDAEISAKGVDTAGFWPYYRQYVPFRRLAGTVDAEAEITGRLEEFSSTGKISLNGGQLDFPAAFRQAIATKSIKLKYSLELNNTSIDIKAIEANVDGAGIRGSCAIRDYRGEDPRITAVATTSRLDFAKNSQFIPYGIIVKDTAEWIEQHLTGGVYQLDEGRLDGRISQILHMESGQNYNVLAIKARVEKGTVSYGKTVPEFRNIKGLLEISGKDFYLRNMSGNFGASPLTLEGRITDYPLDKPSSYPFKMVISPAMSELEWLLGKELATQLSYNGNSALTLSGEGTTSAYTLSGDWNLTPASYSYANFVKKPAGTSSRIKFKGTISPNAATLTELNYTLASLNLTLSAKYAFAQANSLDILINTNKLALQDLAPLSPFLSAYQPAGLGQLSLQGVKTAPEKDWRWQGTVALSNATIHYSPDKKPVKELTGTINFKDDLIESSQITAKIGTTGFKGTASISSLNPIAVQAAFTSPRIDLADFGYRHPQKMPQITKVSGDVAVKGNRLTIRTLAAQLNNSELTVKGVINDIDLMKADLTITAPFLDISDLILLGGIEARSTGSSPPLPAPTLKAALKADAAVFDNMKFDKLKATATLANETLLIEQLDSDFDDGKLTAKGKIDFSAAQTHYQTEFKLAKASTDKVSRLIYGERSQKEFTGVLTLSGDMSASGSSGNDLKKSAAGTIKIHSQKGMLRQFPWLSKVFSILNVSQLFKFKLPDMVSEGMPYNDLKATFKIKNGFIRSDDLFLQSHAMNMSLVGTYDFVGDNFDLTLGIQPLQTVDKVVSKIPVVGWILTGKNKAVFSTYFEIKGKASDPKISAIPITSLGKGVLGIFKRVFQLPAKLFTDTGEVILGN